MLIIIPLLYQAENLTRMKLRMCYYSKWWEPLCENHWFIQCFLYTSSINRCQRPNELAARMRSPFRFEIPNFTGEKAPGPSFGLVNSRQWLRIKRCIKEKTNTGVLWIEEKQPLGAQMKRVYPVSLDQGGATNILVDHEEHSSIC